MRIVLDTNVLIAAFHQPLRGPSFSRNVFDAVVNTDTVIVSFKILEEFRKACARKLKLSALLTEQLIDLIAQRTHLNEPAQASFQHIPPSLRDPTDQHVLALTLTVKADLLLTWDQDLLVLNKVGPTRIRTPRQFWDEIS